MKIIENYDPLGVPAKDILPGDVFVYSGSYFIRVQESSSSEEILSTGLSQRIKNGIVIVAADLATGEIAIVHAEEKVPPIYSRIRINGRAD